MINPITALDAALLAHVYQPLIDATQKTPRWWARQAGIMFAVAGLMRLAVKDGPVIGDWSGMLAVLAILVLSTAFVAATASDALMALIVGGDWVQGVYRMIVMMLNLMRLLSYILAAYIGTFNFSAEQAFYMLSDACWLSFLYFAACRPPRPPKRRHSLRLTSA